MRTNFLPIAGAAVLLMAVPAGAADVLELDAPAPGAVACDCAPTPARAVLARSAAVLAVPAAVVVPDPVAPVGPAVVYGPPLARYTASYIVDQGPSYTVPAVPYVTPSVYEDGYRRAAYVGRAALGPDDGYGVRYGVSYGSGYGADYGVGYGAGYAYGPRYGHYGYGYRGARVGYGYRGFGYGRHAAAGWSHRPAYRGYPGVAFHQPRAVAVRVGHGGFRAHGFGGGSRGYAGGGFHHGGGFAHGGGRYR